MSGKSRYGGVMSSASRYDTAADDRSMAPTTAATVATDAAVQASWAQYVQNLVSEQIAAIHDGVVDGLSEVINEQLDHLFDETNKTLQRELDGNSARLEAALADIRAAKAEMREEIRAEMRAEIADRTALIKQPADGVPGPQGEKGEQGSLPTVEPYTPGRIYYRGNVVADETGSYQAKRDTAKVPCPESEDWTCLARSGTDGQDGRPLRPRGTYDPNGQDYCWLDVVMLNGSSFVALRDDPGPCPGENWQLVASAGPRPTRSEGRAR